MTAKTLLIALLFAAASSMSIPIHYLMADGELTPTHIAVEIIFALVFGVIFAVVVQRLAVYGLKRVHVDFEPGEVLLKDGGANHFRGLEGVGGRLALTDRRLVFKSHKLNIQNHQSVFPLFDIVEVGARKTFGLLENRLSVRLVNDESHEFVVDGAREWIAAIKDAAARASASQTPGRG